MSISRTKPLIVDGESAYAQMIALSESETSLKTEMEWNKMENTMW